jgi:AcrR family transcriptional regulator
MRALPGRASRTPLGESTAWVTRDSLDDDRRQRILRATGELVAKRGYGGATVELIAKRAGIGFRTFHKHFDSKEACFLELFDRTMERSQERIDAAVAADPGAPWPGQVVIALRTLFETILEDPLIARATIVEAPTVGPAIIGRYERAMTLLSPLLRHGREFKTASAVLPVTLEDTLAGGVFWSAYQRLIGSEVERIEALLPEAIEFVLRPYLGEAEAAQWAGRARAEAPMNGSTEP